ncbi:1-acyl-sn-glycerol-3-phosphate acyltransferase [Sphingobacterium luzhongxinii]|uniref:1-acyl-sn-glycerol-3-phosphate acyltransferase n=1 Tax=Sphingobacterium luzhongxinii TaxID=2654181 RepID=UPI0013DA6DA3|nr:1-acyl-sn-glycerol-3-phosphate acyltransferase [Sphingobacterium sp. xlx-73]
MMHLIFYHIYCWVQRNKTIAGVIAFLFLLFFGFLASKLRFEEDITQIVPKSEKSDLTTKAIRQINFSDKITVLLERTPSTPVEDLAMAAQHLADTLAQDSVYIKEINGRLDDTAVGQTYDFVYEHIPFFLDNADYDSLAVRISMKGMSERMSSNYQTLSSPSGFVLGDFIQKDPLGLAVMGLEKLQRIGIGDSFLLYDGFIMSKDSTQILLFLSPMYEGAETERNKAFAEELYSLQRAWNSNYEGRVTVSYFGSALVAVANADQIKEDILKTILISMSVLMVLLVLFYRMLYIPVLVFIPTIFAAVFALGCLYLYKPVISAISLSIGAVLIGITIDFTLHILTHFKKNPDVKVLFKELTKPLLMSGTTNAVAFLCLLFVHSTALIDLGVFASITLVASAVFTLLIIPHLYKPKEELKHNSLLDKIAGFPFERSKVLLFSCVILIGVSLFTSSKVQFNNDLAGLNYMPTDLAETETRLDKLTNTSAKSLYVVATGNTLDMALQRNEEIAAYLNLAKEKDLILDFSNVSELLNPIQVQQAKIAAWNSFWHYHNKELVIENLRTIGEQYGFTADAYEQFFGLLREPFFSMQLSDFGQLPSTGIRDFVVGKNGFFTVSSLVKLDEKYRNQLIKKLEEIPGVVVVDRKQLNETFLGKLRDDFNALVGYSSLAILLILWLFFRRVELVLLASIPIGLTGLVTAGLMGLFGLEFNIFSAIVCTLVFGHGVDFSIFMTAALQKQYSTGEDELRVFRTSILLAVLTTVLAIGALIFAKHPALISISSVSLIGVFAAVVITFVFYPIIFRFFITDRARRGKSPFTLFILLWSLLFFLYYGLGCIVLSFFARLILPIIPVHQVRKDKFLRYTVSKFMKSVLYGYPLVTNKTTNLYGEGFERPAVVIGNHSSFLDTLTMGMLVPKMIFLVNDWVWKSPIFGKAVRVLGFYPTSNGVEESLDFLREKVAQGYSIVVFPEGTRSYDNQIKRFHKGAFYLAEQLQLDILPVYIHGNGDVLPKGDVLIFPGQLRPIVGERIPIADETYGKTYSERTKSISASFKASFEDQRLALENADYFVAKIKLAYLYKEDEIVGSVKDSLKQWKQLFWELNMQLPQGGDWLHWSSSFGELDYLLSLQQGKRKVLGLIGEEECRRVAESIYWSSSRSVRFTAVHQDSDLLLISRLLFAEDYSWNGWSAYPCIVNINSGNNLDFLLKFGFVLASVKNGIHIYRKMYAGV